MDLFITFGVRYARESHPTLPLAHPDGYLRVTGAEDQEAARAAVIAAIDRDWAFDYTEPPSARYAPRGELAVLNARTGVITPTVRALARASEVGA